MATLVLSDLEEEVIRFVLDTTLEQWEDQAEGQRNIMAGDPSLTSLEQLLELTGDMDKLYKTLKRVRARLDMLEV
jgi:hypothetical protein